MSLSMAGANGMSSYSRTTFELRIGLGGPACLGGGGMIDLDFGGVGILEFLVETFGILGKVSVTGAS